MAYGSSSHDNCYSTAVGSLDWLDTSYTPLQLVEKYTLPTLVRICEGYYGNTHSSCFSATDVLKLHEIKRIEMIVASPEDVIDLNESDTSDTESVGRICFPKHFTGVFDMVPTASESTKTKKSARSKTYKGVRKLAEHLPHFVRVVKRPGKSDCADIVKGDVLKIIGPQLESCISFKGEHGYLSCCKVNARNFSEEGREILLNFIWDGTFEKIHDPEGYTLSELLKTCTLPCKVTLRNPQSVHLKTPLPQLKRTLILEREITREFIMATTFNVGSPSDGDCLKKTSLISSAVQRSVIILSMNVDVLFQITQDMVHKREAYTALVERFGQQEYFNKIPAESFICEHAAPFVTTVQSSHVPPLMERALSINAPMSGAHSRSDLQLATGQTGMYSRLSRSDDGYIHHRYGNVPAHKDLTKRRLPPLPKQRQASRRPCESDFEENQDLSSSRDPLLYANCPLLIGFSDVSENSVMGAAVDKPAVTTATFSYVSSYAGRTPRVPFPVLRSAATLPRRSGMVALPQPTDGAVDDTALASTGAFLPPPPKELYGNSGNFPSLSHGGAVPDPHSNACSIKQNPSTTTTTTSPQKNPSARGDPSPRSHRQAPGIPVRKQSLLPPTSNSALDNSAPFTAITSRSRNTQPDPSCRVLLPGEEPPVSSPGTQPQITALTQGDDGSLSQPAARLQSPSHRAVVRYGQTSLNRQQGKGPSSRSEEQYLLPIKQTAGDRGANDQDNKRNSCDSPFDEGVYWSPSKDKGASSGPELDINEVVSIPRDLRGLTTRELSQCIRLLNIDDEIVQSLHDKQINGDLLLQLEYRTIKSELALTDFEAEKLDAFRRGWRPDVDGR